jgi:hypothetical protein
MLQQLSGEMCKKLDSPVSSSVVEADTSAAGGGTANQRKARIKREPVTANVNASSAGKFYTVSPLIFTFCCH